ncbi:M15 family metallopeptidase [Acaricomes phytoseiuli]|uniref:M15 family metallopeptidase n=1 Tax=Acaricomes phytoseiuli TaxID=291968 RepID=UPI00035D5EF4|nr:M15 family metallopeptidase [Acaricomes phytoseiuli]MCW1249956.1 M15 family metallopeptidase [Acaricomes phytoseiuli]
MSDSMIPRRTFSASVLGGVSAMALSGAGDPLEGALKAYGVSRRGLVIDSLLTEGEAIGNSRNPRVQGYIDKMRPYLSVLSVIYRGYDGAVHLGQLVVNRALAGEAEGIFLEMFRIGFPIASVIPQSQFGYDDEKSDDRSMAVNNSSCYRPDTLRGTGISEHAKGAAFDINTFTNPMDTSQDTTLPAGSRKIIPPGAAYDPQSQGAIIRYGEVQRAWQRRGYEWGGNWGYPPAAAYGEFFREGYYDYQHFQLGCTRVNQIYQNHALLPLPPGSTRNKCS